MLATWVLTVACETTSASAISALERPRPSKVSTSSSREVRPPRAGGGGAPAGGRAPAVGAGRGGGGGAGGRRTADVAVEETAENAGADELLARRDGAHRVDQPVALDVL